jgi:hypothetical protein
MTTQWKTGQSGNPQGRPRGSGEIAKLRSMVIDQLPQIINILLEKARAGDMQAIRLLLDRTVPPLRSQEPAISLELPSSGSFTDQGRAVIQAVSQEEIDPSRGSALVTSIAQLARVSEIDELTNRIKVLEEKLACETSKDA